MKTIYIVYEIDNHKSFSSVNIKVLTTSKKIAKRFYKENKSDYENDWYLILAKFDPTTEFSIDANLVRDFETIKESRD